MSKKLVGMGVWQYPLDEQGFEEAKHDADALANQPSQQTGTPPPPNTCYYVMQDQSGYYGPINDAKRVRDFGARFIAYTAKTIDEPGVACA